MSNDKIYEDFDSDWSLSSAYPRIHKMINHPQFNNEYAQFLSEKDNYSPKTNDLENFITICLSEQPNFKMSSVTKSAIKKVGRARDIFEYNIHFIDFIPFVQKLPEKQFCGEVEEINKFSKKMTSAEYAIWYTNQLKVLEEVGIDLNAKKTKAERE